MGLLDEFFTAPAGGAGGGTIDQIARQVGGSPDQVRAIAHDRGIGDRRQPDGLGALLQAAGGGHRQHPAMPPLRTS
jgi:hypothetical protein